MNFEEKVNPELLPVFTHLLEEWNFDDIQFERIKIIEIGKKMTRLSYTDRVTASEHFITDPAVNSNLRIKIYQPKERGQILPGVLFIHGGGFIIGSPEVEEALCYRYVGEINCVVVSVDYRLAPENPFPAGLEDCYAALKWFSQNASELKIDASRIAVTGGSAGGGLTAALCLLARDRKGPEIVFQMPLSPMLDDRNITPSSNQITDKRVLSHSTNVKAWELYLDGIKKDEVSQYAAPSRATDLSGLPPAYIIVGELDPLRDETIDYVLRLSQAGVSTEFCLYPGCFHGFEAFAPLAEISKRASNGYAQALKRALYK
ncbi:MAG: alpha/beta hydrolase [Desulfobacterium sp.]|nr:alpha/beta hydrolase [Desulfobacterium sp.]MBU3948133.1 alpha/beta hydrolase [Pseudomonadota bacterium]MBU4010908.1 alpha/beta hydrolase [Pseudomonadota bacterium]MBU4036134.1 alpha/beta hydrolase [Pseudomonadota bacterium]